MQSHSQMNAWCGCSVTLGLRLQPAQEGLQVAMEEGRVCTRSVLQSSSKSQPLSEALRKQAGSEAPVPASLLFIPPSGGCHLARTIIRSHTKWPMEEKSWFYSKNR